MSRWISGCIDGQIDKLIEECGAKKSLIHYDTVVVYNYPGIQSEANPSLTLWATSNHAAGHQ